MSCSYMIQIEFEDKEHLEWIGDFVHDYSDYVEAELTENTELGSDSTEYYTLSLTGDNIIVLQRIASYICNKIQIVGYMEACSYFSEGLRYYISYVSRVINMVCCTLENSLISVFSKKKNKK